MHCVTHSSHYQPPWTSPKVKRKSSAANALYSVTSHTRTAGAEGLNLFNVPDCDSALYQASLAENLIRPNQIGEAQVKMTRRRGNTVRRVRAARTCLHTNKIRKISQREEAGAVATICREEARTMARTNFSLFFFRLKKNYWQRIYTLGEIKKKVSTYN